MCHYRIRRALWSVAHCIALKMALPSIILWLAWLPLTLRTSRNDHSFLNIDGWAHRRMVALLDRYCGIGYSMMPISELPWGTWEYPSQESSSEIWRPSLYPNPLRIRCLGGSAIDLRFLEFQEDSSFHNLSEFLGIILGIIGLTKLGFLNTAFQP